MTLGTTDQLLRTFARNRIACVGLVLVCGIVSAALLAPWVAPFDPVEQHMGDRLMPPGSGYLLGTDGYGRDVLSRILWGSRVSLLAGLSSVAFGMVFGVAIGVVAGYKSGTLDHLVMRGMDILMCLPTFLLGLMVLTVLGAGFFKLIVAIGIALVPRFARLARGPTVSVRERDFISASRAVGQRDPAIIAFHVLPNIMGPLLVLGTLWIATAILIESSLSFLGLGIQPPLPSWGHMISDGVERLSEAAWLSTYPGVAVSLTVLAFNMVGDGLRDILDPKLRAER
jgi:peptide/nickel transport system permease protein